MSSGSVSVSTQDGVRDHDFIRQYHIPLVVTDFRSIRLVYDSWFCFFNGYKLTEADLDAFDFSLRIARELCKENSFFWHMFNQFGSIFIKQPCIKCFFMKTKWDHNVLNANVFFFLIAIIFRSPLIISTVILITSK